MHELSEKSRGPTSVVRMHDEINGIDVANSALFRRRIDRL
jgi:hypothetical protein